MSRVGETIARIGTTVAISAAAGYVMLYGPEVYAIQGDTIPAIETTLDVGSPNVVHNRVLDLTDPTVQRTLGSLPVAVARQSDAAVRIFELNYATQRQSDGTINVQPKSAEAGTGFKVDDRHIMTAGHVVEKGKYDTPGYVCGNVSIRANTPNGVRKQDAAKIAGTFDLAQDTVRDEGLLQVSDANVFRSVPSVPIAAHRKPISPGTVLYYTGWQGKANDGLSLFRDPFEQPPFNRPVRFAGVVLQANIDAKNGTVRYTLLTDVAGYDDGESQAKPGSSGGAWAEATGVVDGINSRAYDQQIGVEEIKKSFGITVLGKTSVRLSIMEQVSHDDVVQLSRALAQVPPPCAPASH